MGHEMASARPVHWVEIRTLLLAAMVFFVFTLGIGILNGTDLVEFEHRRLLGHVHSGTLGWLSLSVFAASLWLFGGGGTDVLAGGGGADYLDGGIGDDALYAGTGRDIGLGGFGADSSDGGAGIDQLYGDSGDDEATFILAPGGGVQASDVAQERLLVSAGDGSFRHPHRAATEKTSDGRRNEDGFVILVVVSRRGINGAHRRLLTGSGLRTRGRRRRGAAD